MKASCESDMLYFLTFFLPSVLFITTRQLGARYPCSALETILTLKALEIILTTLTLEARGKMNV